MRGWRPFSWQAWTMRLALLGAALAVILGVPGWLEAILWVFLVGAFFWVMHEARKRRASH
jgi:hypothetical protein